MKRNILLLIVVLGFQLGYAQQGISEFENLEEVSQKGFFKEHFKGLFKGFTDLGEPFNVSGGVGLNMRSYAAYGVESRQDPFFYSLNANANVRIYKLNLPFSILVSAKNTDSSYPNIRELIRAFRNNVENKIENQRNRFVRFGTSPQYKWIKLHLGHRSMNFSQFTLANLNFLGAGIELTPGKFRLAAMTGRLAKAEPLDLSLVTPNIPVFERRGWGMKVGYGTNEAYLDLILFKGMDDINSLSIPDTLIGQPTPEENLVLGFNAQKTFFEKVTLKVEYAASAQSPNAGDATTNNQFPHPKFLIEGRTTTQYKNALETSLNYQAKIFSVGATYKRIDPNYRSLGAYFFNSDIEDITGNVSFGLFKNAINVNANAGVQRNNLDNTQPSRLTRFIGAINLAYSLNSFNIGLNYSNNSSDVAYILDPELDSLNVVIVTSDVGLNASYNFQDGNNNQHVLTGTFNIQDVTDDIVDPMQTSASQMLVGNLVYTYALTASKWNFSVKANYNQNELASMLMHRYGLGFGISKSLFENSMNLGIDVNYFLLNNETAGDQSNLNSQFRMAYKLGDNTSMNMNWALLSSTKTLNGVSDSFAELTGTVGIQYTFARKSKEEREKRKKEQRKPKDKENNE